MKRLAGVTITEFIEARLDEDEKTAHHSGPARVAWLTFRDEAGQMLYTVAASDHGEADWIADGKVLAAPASASVVYDPARVPRVGTGLASEQPETGQAR